MDAVTALRQLDVPFKSVSGGEELLLDCPLCGKRKLYMNSRNALWDCKVCGASGNAKAFIKMWWENYTLHDEGELRLLASSRGLSEETLLSFQLRRYSKGWVIPYFSREGELEGVRVATRTRFMNLAGFGVMVWGFHLDSRQDEVFVCEGEWDAMALMEMGLNLEESLVLAVPGASIWRQWWTTLLGGRKVIALYDNDEAGRRGIERLSEEKVLGGYLDWTKVAESVQVKEKMDVRDLKMIGWKIDDLRRCLVASESPIGKGGGAIFRYEGILPSDIYSMEDELEKVYLMDETHRDVLRISMSQLLSVGIESKNPLWVMYVGAPGSGKSEILQLLSYHPKVMVVSSLTPHTLVSGWMSRDSSLLPKMNGKLVILKDFTEILSLGAQEINEIFSTLRGAYDGYVFKQFGNGVIREYSSLFFGLAAATTSAIDAIVDSSLGERSLKYRLHLLPNSYIEEAKRAGEMSLDSSPSEEARKQVSAWAMEVVRRTEMRQRYDDIKKLAVWGLVVSVGRVSVMRDSYSGRVLHLPDLEVPTRVTIQLKKLVEGLMALLDDKEVSEDIVKRVVVSSCSRITWAVIVYLLGKEGGVSPERIASDLGFPDQNVRRTLEDLSLCGLVQSFRDEGELERRWTLAKPPIANLWDEIRKLEEERIGGFWVPTI